MKDSADSKMKKVNKKINRTQNSTGKKEKM